MSEIDVLYYSALTPMTDFSLWESQNYFQHSDILLKRFMKQIVSTCLFLLVSLCVKSQAVTLAITDCNVITMQSNIVLHHQTILISNDNVLRILPSTQWANSQNIRTVDGSGKYVVPSLADMHIHVNEYSNWVFDILLSYGVTTIRVMAGNEASLKWRDSVKIT